MNAKISAFVIGVETIIYLLLYNLHDCTFNKKELSKVREFVNDIEDGQKFIEKEFEDQKEKIKDLIRDNKKNVFLENITKPNPYTKVRKKTK